MYRFYSSLAVANGIIYSGDVCSYQECGAPVSLTFRLD